MDIKKITPGLSVANQINLGDLGLIASQGFKTVVCLRPDGEGDDQPRATDLQSAAQLNGLTWFYLPVQPGQINDGQISDFNTILREEMGPVLAYCRTGTRAATLWALTEAGHLDVEAILAATREAGYDLEAMRSRLQSRVAPLENVPNIGRRHEVLIVGGGAGGLATAASLLKRQPDLDVAIVEPKSEHYYQPGWTLVGGGVFKRSDTVKSTEDYIPHRAKWYQAGVASFQPANQCITLEDGESIGYRILVVAPGIALNWDGIEGLRDTLGQNGVTSNYQFDMAPYTWELVQSTKRGKALFTQPPMPIKCAGAPQKAMYLSCDHWLRSGVLNHINVEFCSAGPSIFGVADFVPALNEYIDKYAIQTHFQTNLVAVDGAAKRAYFKQTQINGDVVEVEKPFDMLHVCPPQRPPAFVANSPLADAAGWLDVNPETLQHPKFGDVFALGDGCNAPNAKTAAAVRKQAPVVAENVLMALRGQAPRAIYDGYGSCPLTVERGKIVLAEFGYGGKYLPSLPTWLIDGRKPTKMAWLLKEKMLPWLYWEAMLQGREWLAVPEILDHSPTPHQAPDALNCQREGK